MENIFEDGLRVVGGCCCWVSAVRWWTHIKFIAWQKQKGWWVECCHKTTVSLNKIFFAFTWGQNIKKRCDVIKSRFFSCCGGFLLIKMAFVCFYPRFMAWLNLVVILCSLDVHMDSTYSKESYFCGELGMRLMVDLQVFKISVIFFNIMHYTLYKYIQY